MSDVSTTERPTAGRNLRILLEYVGTGFAGWQFQPDQRTVQGTLAEAARKILGEPEAAVIAAGRTDAGVHAIGQVVHLETGRTLATKSLASAFNAALPPDVRVRSVVEAPRDFHARYGAVAKEYRYQVFQGGPASPFHDPFVAQCRAWLDTDAMASAARLFEGSQDLSSFRASSCDSPKPIRTVYESRVAAHGHLVVYAIRARGFHQHMVRIIAGTLIDVGHGRISVKNVKEIIAERDRSRAAATAPPRGLFMYRIEYTGETPIEAVAEPVLNFYIH